MNSPSNSLPSQKLSQVAFAKSASVIQAIHTHPFIQELSVGSLCRSKFAYYIEQDTLYLRDFARALAAIASRAPFCFMKTLLSFSQAALGAEQELVHGFFRKTFGLQQTDHLAPATLSYAHYLLQASTMAPVEVAMASVLPCFWVYQEVGEAMKAKSPQKNFENPYQQWIDTYSGKEFSESVRQAIDIFDEMALETTRERRQEMVEAFYKSTVLEWRFWNDAYHGHIFDAIT